MGKIAKFGGYCETWKIYPMNFENFVYVFVQAGKNNHFRLKNYFHRA